MLRLSRHCAWLLLGLLVVGCGGKSAPKTVPVSGKVTWDNRPLPNAVVTFTPLEAKEGQLPATSTGRTDEQGHFSLKLDQYGKDGAVPGGHRVRIAIMDRGAEGKAARGQLLPEEYNRKSTLTFQVPAEGTSTANFPLSSNPSAPPVRRRPGGR